MIIQWNLCNLIFQLYDIRQKIMVPKVFLFTKIKLEYSNILYNLTHFHGDFDTFPWSLWHISLVPLTHFPGSFDTFPWSLWHISLVPLTHFPGPFDTFPWSLWHSSLVPLTHFPGPFVCQTGSTVYYWLPCFATLKKYVLMHDTVEKFQKKTLSDWHKITVLSWPQ
jgi:hypothetical protein